MRKPLTMLTARQVELERFVWLIQGSGVRDMLALAKFDSTWEECYFFDPSDKSARPLCKGFAPWQMVFILTRYHRKHRCSLRKLPSLVPMQRAINNFVNKLHWRSILSRDSGIQHWMATKKLGFSMDTPACSSTEVPPELRGWTSRFRTQVLNATEASIARARSRGQFGDKSPRFVKLFLPLFSSMELVPVPTDKDGGYCLVKHTVLCQAAQDVLNGPWYSRSFEDIADITVATKQNITALAKRIAYFEAPTKDDVPSIMGLLCKKFASTFQGSLIAELGLTVKTHKPDGEVAFRNLHKASSSILKGVGSWLAHQLDNLLREKCPWIVKNALDVKLRLDATTPSPGERLVRLDLKDFFMSGSVSQITSLVMRGATDNAHSRLVDSALWICLDNQYVSTPLIPGATYKVVRGSGMGLVHSSAVQDYAFFIACEQGIVDCISDWGIRWYFRCRDDIVFSATSIDHARTFIDALRHRAADVFDIKLEQVSRSTVQFLNVAIAVRPDRYNIQSTFKKTALCRPLGSDSMHSSVIHRTWPINMVRQHFLLNSNRRDAMNARNIIAERLLRYNFDSHILASVANCDGMKINTHHSLVGNYVKLWCVLPFHGIWCKSVLRVLFRFKNSQELDFLLRYVDGSQTPCVQISWRNLLTPMMGRIHRSSLCEE